MRQKIACSLHVAYVVNKSGENFKTKTRNFYNFFKIKKLKLGKKV